MSYASDEPCTRCGWEAELTDGLCDECYARLDSDDEPDDARATGTTPEGEG